MDYVADVLEEIFCSRLPSYLTPCNFLDHFWMGVVIRLVLFALSLITMLKVHFRERNRKMCIAIRRTFGHR
jgi:hypothetical protein